MKNSLKSSKTARITRRRINMFINYCNAIFTSYADLADTDIHVAIEKLLKKEK